MTTPTHTHIPANISSHWSHLANITSLLWTVRDCDSLTIIPYFLSLCVTLSRQVMFASTARSRDWLQGGESCWAGIRQLRIVSQSSGAVCTIYIILPDQVCSVHPGPVSQPERFLLVLILYCITHAKGWGLGIDWHITMLHWISVRPVKCKHTRSMSDHSTLAIMILEWAGWGLLEDWCLSLIWVTPCPE